MAVIALNGAGESEPTPVRAVRVELNAYPAPSIQHVEAADGGFFVGYATQPDDYLFQVQYTRQSGDYAQAQILQTTNRGVLFVPGLTNGQRYFFRLRRLKDNNYPTAWSAEQTVTPTPDRPDGGYQPPAPVIRGVVGQSGEDVLCYEPVKKAVGYVIEYRTDSAEAWTRARVAATQSGYVMLSEIGRRTRYQLRMAVLTSAGQSSFSPTLDVRNDD